MEFTPKKTAKFAYRHNPYASGGSKYLNNFSRRSNKLIDVTPPPRKFGLTNSRNFENQTIPSSKVCLKFSRTSHILQNSQVQNSTKENFQANKKFYPSNHCDSSQKRKKHSLTDKQIIDTSFDPYNVFTDEEDENDDEILLSSKHEKIRKGDVDKENNNNNVNLQSFKYSPKLTTCSTPKKKTINITKSNILYDLSPQKVKFALGSDKRNIIKNDNLITKIKTSEEKENLVTKEKKASHSEIQHPHMIGFPNFGNTCYLNAVIQTLVSLEPFIIDLCNIVESGIIPSGSVTHSLWNIIVVRQKLDSSVLKPSLRTLKENVEKIDGSFLGFKMQDANEFLTQLLDMVKDEITKFTSQMLNSSVNNLEFSSETSLAIQKDENMNACTSNSSSGSGTSNFINKFDKPPSLSPLSLNIKVKEKEYVLNDEDVSLLTPKLTNVEKNNNIKNSSTNPVINNFEFELLESFRCLGCGETEGRKQKHFALYVDLPKEGDESIQKAIETYMSEDQRDLRCEKCQHRKASFLTSFIQVPRFLIVQMKRYEYKAKQNECIKVSSKVDVNTWLHLDKLTSKEAPQPPTVLTDLLRKELKYNCWKVPPSPPRLAQPLDGATDRMESEGCAPSDSEPKTPTKNDEDKELEEVIIRSLEDTGDASRAVENDADKEEEEFQRAIKLSLQDMGAHFSNPVEEESEQPQIQVKELNGEETNGKHSYHLLSVISHFGLTTCTGHYVSDVLNVAEGQWYHYDDESVSSLPESVVLSEGRQKNGYIFFYVHRFAMWGTQLEQVQWFKYFVNENGTNDADIESKVTQEIFITPCEFPRRERQSDNAEHAATSAL